MRRAMFLVLTTISTSALAQAPAAPPTVPAAVAEIAADLPQTPVEVSAVKENGQFRLRTTKTSLALYTFDQDTEDRSACLDRCAENWPPVIAPTGSEPMGEWKPIPRAGGELQWTYRGRPVYSYRGDTPTRAAGDGVGGQWHLVQPISIAPSSPAAAPAAAVAGTGPAIPAGVGIGKSKTGAPIFTNLHGYAVYAFDRDQGGKSACLGACASAWPPLIAAPDAKPVGDWTLAARGDGTAQWSYKGRPAYIYSRDLPNGGELGHGHEGVWHLMAF